MTPNAHPTCLPRTSVVTCDEQQCSGHGTCMTTSMLFDVKNSIHRTTDTFTPWEADRTTACMCDFGYTGAACEMSECLACQHTSFVQSVVY